MRSPANRLAETALEKSRAVLVLREAVSRCNQAGRPDRSEMWLRRLAKVQKDMQACSSALEYHLRMEGSVSRE